jgi:hypothetical protein
MKPSVEQMLEAAQLALREQVAPLATDQRAASALRSVDVILSHLQARVPVEGPMLFEDNRDLAEVLAKAADLALDAKLRARLGEFAAEQAAMGEYPPVHALDDLNIKGRGLLDELLMFCHAHKEEVVHGALRGYLERHLERERPFYFPVFVGRPF